MTATLVVGADGAGKTWLLRQMAQTAHEHGERVLIYGDPDEWPEWDTSPDLDEALDDCVLVLDEAYRPEAWEFYRQVRTHVRGDGAGPTRILLSAHHPDDPIPTAPDEVITL